jgi:hypothetical protein
MISLSDAYIVVAHDVKKIFVSGPREVMNPMNMQGAMELERIGKEGYTMSRTVKGALTEISLLNDRHVSCREYHLSFDSTGIRKSVMRMPDPMALEDNTKDKLLSVTIKSWEEGKVRKDLLRMERYIALKEGIPMPSKELQGYELIKD